MDLNTLAQTNPFKVMGLFRNALQAAQQRTGDPTLSTAVKKGKIQVCRVTYDSKGRSTVTPVTDYLPMDDAMTYLEKMGA